MEIGNYKYTKDDGSATNRRLYIVQSAPAQNVRALDLTDLDEDFAVKVSTAYDDWVVSVKKPFDKLAKDFQKINLLSFEDYLKNSGIEIAKPSIVKSFKVDGLVKDE